MLREQGKVAKVEQRYHNLQERMVKCLETQYTLVWKLDKTLAISICAMARMEGVLDSKKWKALLEEVHIL